MFQKVLDLGHWDESSGKTVFYGRLMAWVLPPEPKWWSRESQLPHTGLDFMPLHTHKPITIFFNLKILAQPQWIPFKILDFISCKSYNWEMYKKFPETSWKLIHLQHENENSRNLLDKHDFKCFPYLFKVISGLFFSQTLCFTNFSDKETEWRKR